MVCGEASQIVTIIISGTNVKRKRSKRTAAYWIKRLRLRPHPEGGYYRETYRSREIIAKADLPRRYGGQRAFATAIYFLLRGNQFSAFHRLKSDEIWHFYDGFPLNIFIIKKNGALKKIRLGLNLAAGEQPQAVIEANSWFAARLVKQNRQPQAGPPVAEKSEIENRKSYALIGCTVAPGFDFADFEIGNRAVLCRRFPERRCLELIRKLI